MGDDFLPYFNVYAAETLADEWFDVAAFDERGLWFSLLLKNWVNGSIPEDPEEIARLLHADAVALRPVWERIKGRFVAHPSLPGRLTSRRQEEERAKARKKVKGAKKAAKLRWAKGKAKAAEAMRSHSGGTADAMPTEQISTAQHSTEQIKPITRAARVGVGHPAFEAVEHWTKTVWPKTSSVPCPEISTAQGQSLAGLCAKNTTPVVLAAMDRAAADPFWADKLDLDTFIAKFPRFLHDTAPPPPGPRRDVGAEVNDRQEAARQWAAQNGVTR